MTPHILILLLWSHGFAPARVQAIPFQTQIACREAQRALELELLILPGIKHVMWCQHG